MKKNVDMKNKYSIKIPENLKTIYCTKANLLIFIGPLSTKVLKPCVKIFQIKNYIFVSKIPTLKVSTNTLKNSNQLQGTVIAKIKLILIEISNVLYKKLTLVGVGYRAFVAEDIANQITLKLGYSHLIYQRIPSKLSSFCLKFTKLFIFGVTSYSDLTQSVALIRQCKLPEPYKGKGILHYRENIVLKKGKKV